MYIMLIFSRGYLQMKLVLNILLLIVGMVVLIRGADFFVSGASAVAKKMKVPSLIIGLTIVAIGTSLPELAISIASAIKGSVDMSVGNVVGSNLSNMLLIIGTVSCFAPITIKPSSKKFDFPFMILVTAALLLFSCDEIITGEAHNTINRIESFVFLGLLAFYLVKNIKDAKKSQPDFENDRVDYDADGISTTREGIVIRQSTTKSAKQTKELATWKIVLYLIFGLAAVVLGGECVSRTAQYIAISLGMSEALVGLTIVALGTSLPELVTSVVAAKKGETDLAIGNIVGSNIMNIVLILGSVGVITQLPVSGTILTDMSILLAATLIFTLLAFRKMRLARLEGIIMLTMYFAYIAFAIVRNYCF